MKLKFVLSIFLLLIFMIIFRDKFEKSDSMKENFRQEIMQKSINGIVMQKYYFANRPNSPTINVYDGNKGNVIVLTFYNQEIYRSIEVGDSLFKKEGENTIKIIKDSIEVYFQCVIE